MDEDYDQRDTIQHTLRRGKHKKYDNIRPSPSESQQENFENRDIQSQKYGDRSSGRSSRRRRKQKNYDNKDDIQTPTHHGKEENYNNRDSSQLHHGRENIPDETESYTPTHQLANRKSHSRSENGLRSAVKPATYEEPLYDDPPVEEVEDDINIYTNEPYNENENIVEPLNETNEKTQTQFSQTKPKYYNLFIYKPRKGMKGKEIIPVDTSSSESLLSEVNTPLSNVLFRKEVNPLNNLNFDNFGDFMQVDKILR